MTAHATENARSTDERSEFRNVLQPTLVEDPPGCWYCKLETSLSKLDEITPGRHRCKDHAACVEADRERFARGLGSDPKYMAARARGIAAASLYGGAA